MEAEQNSAAKKVILSGIQASGDLTIGHYAGAIKNWAELQNEYECFFMVADLHAITTRQIPADLRRRSLDVVAMYAACGISIEKSTLFLQSHVPEHSQLAWVLNCYTGYGEAQRMTQFKDKSQQHTENVNVGLFSYPVLMAADILLYQADLVPVGEDQKQHIELTRNLAERFNHLYSPTFRVPEPFIPKTGARIMSLQEPWKKMSKSDPNEKSCLFLQDKDDIIMSKIKRAVTDSGTDIIYDPDNRPGVANLITLYHVATGKSIPEIEQEFAGLGYAPFKEAVGNAMVQLISPIRNRFTELRNNKELLADLIGSGAQKAGKRAASTLRKVYKKVGLVDKNL
jgi:tryptophanyl-tRNA synthetase